ncbi:MAG: sulfotransferase [Methylococcaceae bacterium]|nr:sulfotransferase [Methylococcaceae bacterium]
MIKPNLFIIGAPKCGTTALSEYLRSHPSIFMSDPKEPEYFSTDLELRFRERPTLEDYLGYYFNGAGPQYPVIGEASVWYLFSRVAVRDILAFNPRAKFIAMVRNPIDMARSQHAQLLLTLDEEVSDFHTAWNLQQRRGSGRDIPKTCQHPVFLQYGEVCSLGEQLERFYDSVCPEQRMVIFFDDFAADTEKTYRQVMDFLGLPPEQGRSFEKINESKTTRNRLLSRLLNRPPAWVFKIARAIKKRLGIKTYWFHDRLNRLNTRKNERDPLAPEFRQELLDFFRQDIEKIEHLTGRNLDHWKNR